MGDFTKIRSKHLDRLGIKVDGGKAPEASPLQPEAEAAAAAEQVNECERNFHERAGVQCHSDSETSSDRMEAKRTKRAKNPRMTQMDENDEIRC